MIDRDHLKQFLLHEEQTVREFVAEYFEDSWDRGEDLMPLVLEACQLYGDEMNGLVLARASHFSLNQDSLLAVLRRLENAPNANIAYHLNTVIAHAPGDLLAAHEVEILQSPNLYPTVPTCVRRRAEFIRWSAEDLWMELQRFSNESRDAKYVGDIDHGYADDLIDELADRDLPTIQAICGLLVSPDVEEEWLEIFLIDLAGVRRIREAIPAIVDKFRIDADYMLERAMHALARIRDPEAVHLISQTFEHEDETFKLYTSDVLGKIKHPESEEAILGLLSTEEDLTIRTNLCYSLCQLFSERCIERVREEISWGYDESLVSLEDTLLDVAVVLGVSLPEADTWRAQREEQQRRLAARKAELEEMGRRYEALKAQGIDPFARLRHDSEDDEDESESIAPTTTTDPDHPEVPFRRAAAKIGRNDPCPCGSGKKYKKCCGKKL
jgi:hypothetical protein